MSLCFLFGVSSFFVDATFYPFDFACLVQAEDDITKFFVIESGVLSDGFKIGSVWGNWR